MEKFGSGMDKFRIWISDSNISFHASTVCVHDTHGPKYLKLLNFNFQTDPDPAYHSYADPHTAFCSNVDTHIRFFSQGLSGDICV